MTREEARKIFEDNETTIENPNYLFTEIGEAWDLAIEALKEPKQGEWIRKTDGLPHLVTIEWFICSECGVQKSEPTPFCPNCGARMKEGDEK